LLAIDEIGDAAAMWIATDFVAFAPFEWRGKKL